MRHNAALNCMNGQLPGQNFFMFMQFRRKRENNECNKNNTDS